MKFRRREFLECAAAGAGGVLLGGRLASAGNAPAGRYDPYEPVTLGKTGLKVTRVGLGTGFRGWRRQSNHTRMGAAKFDALVHAAYDRGIRLFDAADLYGTHPHLARALAKIKRDEYTLVSKVYVRRDRGLPEPGRPPADACVERFCKELKTDHIDIVLLHGVMAEDWNKKYIDHMVRLSKLKKKGVVRAVGVSVHTLGAMKAAAAEPWVDTVHARINPYGVAMDDTADKVLPVLRKVHQAGKGVIGMKIIGAGKFADSDEKRDRSIGFVLNLRCVDAMVVGFEKADLIDDFAARVRKVPRRNAGA